MTLNERQAPASKSSFIDRRTVTFGPAGKSTNVYGRVFFCNAATGAFEMNFNDGEYFPIIGRGVEWALVGDDRYSRLQFRAAIETTVEFYAGNFAYHENVVLPVAKEAQTSIKTGAAQTLAAGATLSLPGTGTGLGYRKHAIITNLDPDLDLDILDSADTPIGQVFFRQANVFATSAALKLKNNNATTMNIRVMEIFYAP